VHAARKAQIKPGDVALVIGSGTIGIVTAMAPWQEVQQGHCRGRRSGEAGLASSLGMISVNVTRQNLNEIVASATDGWGADIVFEASGSEAAVSKCLSLCARRTGRIHRHADASGAGDIVSAQVKEATPRHIQIRSCVSEALLLIELAR